MVAACQNQRASLDQRRLGITIAWKGIAEHPCRILPATSLRPGMALDEIPDMGRKGSLLASPVALTLPFRALEGDDIDSSGALQIDARGERVRLGDRQQLPNHRSIAGLPIRWIERTERQIALLATRTAKAH
jgi:hypothetical protein